MTDPFTPAEQTDNDRSTTPEAMPPIQSYALLAEKSGRPIITLERTGRL